MEKKLYHLTHITLIYILAIMVFAPTSIVHANSYSNKYSGGDGTKENPWQISTAEDLLYLRTDEERDGSWGMKIHYFVVTNDIVLNEDYANYKNWGDKAPANKLSETSSRFGNSTVGLYCASLDGQGHTIYGLYGDGNSLFGYMYNAIIKNLNVSNFYMKNAPLFGTSIAGSSEEFVEENGLENVKVSKGIVTLEPKKINSRVIGGGGALTNEIFKEATINNVSVDIQMTTDATAYTGMIAAYVPSLTNCTTAGKLTVNVKNANDDGYYNVFAGGLAGTIWDGCKINNCTNKATIEVNLPASKKTGGDVGGIFAGAFNADIEIKNCKNQGNINIKTKYNLATAKKQEGTRQFVSVGGLAGSLSKGKIVDSSNKGKLTASFIDKLAGIVGDAQNNVTISNCLNEASINATACGYVAGIVSSCQGKISHCENRGELISTEKMVNKKVFFIGGGVAGIVCNLKAEDMNSSVSYCKNSGHIKAIDTALWLSSAGIADSIYSQKSYTSTVENCLNEGKIEGGLVSGIVESTSRDGNSKQNVVKRCVNTGTVRHNYADDRIAGICFWLNYTTVKDCYNLGKIEKVPNKYRDTRTAQLVSSCNNKSKVENCFALEKKANKWPAVAAVQTGGKKGKITLLSKAKLESNKTVKEIIKNSGVK